MVIGQYFLRKLPFLSIMHKTKAVNLEATKINNSKTEKTSNSRIV